MKYKAHYYAPLALIGLMLMTLLGRGTTQSTFGQEVIYQQQIVNLRDCLDLLTPVPHVDVGNLSATFMLDREGEHFAEANNYAGAVAVSNDGVVTLRANDTAVFGAGQVDVSFGGERGVSPTVARDAKQVPAVTLLDINGDGDSQRVEATGTISVGDVQVEGTNRRLIFTTQKQPSRGKINLGLSLSTNGKVMLDENGDLKTITSSDSSTLTDRSLTWKVHATQTVRGRTTQVDAYFIKNRVQQFDVRLTGAFNPNLPVDLVVTTLYGDHLPITEAVVTSKGETVAVSESPDGVVLTRFDRDKQVASLTYVQGDALQVNDISVAQDETLLLAGTVHNGRTTAMTLLQLSSDLTQINQTFDGRASGLSTGISVLQTDDGRIVAIGEAAAGSKTERPLSTPVTLLLPPQSPSSEIAQLAIVDLEPTMADANAITVLDVPEPSLQVISLIDCKEYLIVTPLIGAVSAVTVSETYSADIDQPAMDSCPEIDHGFGAGLICWKAVRATDFSYTPAPALSDYPQGSVTPSDYQTLNDIENNVYGNVFYNNTTSQWADPGGSWSGENNWAYDEVELALGAALYHTWWGSPIAADINHGAIGLTGIKAVMITDVTFSADDSDDLPHNICPNFYMDDGYMPEHQVATDCFNDFGGSMVLDSVDFDAWISGSYTPGYSVLGSDNSWLPFVTLYVGDPPDEETALADVVVELSRQMSPYVYVMNSLTIHEVQNGEAKQIGETTLPVQAISIP